VSCQAEAAGLLAHAGGGREALSKSLAVTGSGGAAVDTDPAAPLDPEVGLDLILSDGEPTASSDASTEAMRWSEGPFPAPTRGGVEASAGAMPKEDTASSSTAVADV
jgi:hypothetical protein